jgi:putative hydrolase of the HAD superfamily
MIKNFIFDFGEVLVKFNTEYMTSVYANPKDVALIESVVFDRLYWDKLDDGSITDEEIIETVKKRIPERLWSVAEKIYYNWIYNIPEVEGMKDLVSYLKRTYGVKICLLSNISRYFADHSGEIECLKEFDKIVMTGYLGIVKPHREIFDYLCDYCKIKAEESIFIDDNKANIAGADAYGIHTYLFDGDSKKLKAYLDELLSK